MTSPVDRSLIPLLGPDTAVVAMGECTHLDSALAWRRNELFAQLVGSGFRSIALETDRIAALVVDDHVRGVGRLGTDATMSIGFSHGFGRMPANRALIDWIHEYNCRRPDDDRVSFHGFDAAVETISAPSPRQALARVAEYLGSDVDLAVLAGPDQQWSRSEAVLAAAESIGDSDLARSLCCWADDRLVELYARAPELVAATSLAQWERIRVVLDGASGLLRYHRQCARPGEPAARISRLLGTRDALMAANLLDIRRQEADRGPTLVFAHNSHLQRAPAGLEMAGLELSWTPAGAIVQTVLGDAWSFVAGSIGGSAGLDLRQAAVDTYEGALSARVGDWGIVRGQHLPAARVRTDHAAAQGYAPLDAALLAGADAVLHLREGRADSSWI